MDLKVFAKKTLTEATSIANKYFEHVSKIELKEDRSFLSEADLAISKYIKGEIQKNFPDHLILDEEGTHSIDESEYIWIVDPIDGTSNFINDIPHFGVVIGLLKNYEPYLGAISLPRFGDMIICERGSGVTNNDKPISGFKDKNNFIALQFDYRNKEQEIQDKQAKIVEGIVRELDDVRIRNTATIYDFVQVILSKYSGAICTKSKVWDNVAPQAIFEELGGKYTDWDGKNYNYRERMKNVDINYHVVSGNPRMYEHLVKFTK